MQTMDGVLFGGTQKQTYYSGRMTRIFVPPVPCFFFFFKGDRIIRGWTNGGACDVRWSETEERAGQIWSPIVSLIVSSSEPSPTG